MMNFFSYPRWAFVPGKKHATLYISDEQPADVVSYGARTVQKRLLPIVKFSGFTEEDAAGVLSLQRLGEGMKMIINHAARACRLPVNHSGSIGRVLKREATENGQKYLVYDIPVFMRVAESRQKYISLRIWKGGEAAHAVVAIVPALTFWDVPTMAQFERVCFYAADLARGQRP